MCVCPARPAYILRATWMTGSSSSAVNMRSLGLHASSVTPRSSLPTSSSNYRRVLFASSKNSTLNFCKILHIDPPSLSFLPFFPPRALDSIAAGESTAVAGYVEEVLQTLNDLIEYFKQPDSELEHEEKQCLLRSLIKRQDLFKEEVRVGGVINFYAKRKPLIHWWCFSFRWCYAGCVFLCVGGKVVKTLGS